MITALNQCVVSMQCVRCDQSAKGPSPNGRAHKGHLLYSLYQISKCVLTRLGDASSRGPMDTTMLQRMETFASTLAEYVFKTSHTAPLIRPPPIRGAI